MSSDDSASLQPALNRDLFSGLIRIIRNLSMETNRWQLYEQILVEAQSVSQAEGCTLYLLNSGTMTPQLDFIIAHNQPLNLYIVNTEQSTESLKAIPLYNEQKDPNHHHIATHSFFTKKPIYLKDVYNTDQFDIRGIREFDKKHRYQTRNLLSIPLLDHDKQSVGVIQLINTGSEDDESDVFNIASVQVVEALCSLASLLIDNHIMIGEQRDLLVRLASKKNTSALFETIIDEAQKITHAEGGTLYLLRDDEPPHLEFAIIKNHLLKIHQGGTSSQPISLPSVALTHQDGRKNNTNIASYTALTKKIVRIDDAYKNSNFDFSGTREFDKMTGYRSISFLSVPLLNQAKEVIGVLQLVNAKSPSTNQVICFDKKCEPLIHALCTYAAIALENKILLEDHKNLLDSFVQCIAQAIDAKSEHTSNHCQRVPALTEMLARATCEDTHYFPEFSLTDEDWYELQVASWMHDCGKLATPDWILDKATKLQRIHDGIDIVNARFESLKKEKEIELLNLQLNDNILPDEVCRRKAEIEQIEHDRAFVVRYNKGSEFMPPEAQARIHNIANYHWTNQDGVIEPILSQDDVRNLCIERGTLNSDERKKINDHMITTINMLESLPFPKHLRNVPEYAGGHHEKMDGTGFPRGLKRHEMSLQARMMGIADIFEALTSSDRPYKDPMKISQALSILKSMRENNHIDGDLYGVFLEQRVWEEYGKLFLSSEQMDVTDIDAYR